MYRNSIKLRKTLFSLVIGVSLIVTLISTTAQPNLPARSAMQVSARVNPGWLVEIEVAAVRS